MLSKIIDGKSVGKLELKSYTSPSFSELDSLIAEKKREDQRMRILDEHKDDPVKAARQEANHILIEAQKKLKEAETEGELIKTRKEKELRAQLEKEYQVKFDQKVAEIQKNYLKSIEELAQLKENLYKRAEKQMIALVFTIAKKVIHSEIQTSPDIVINMLRKGFEKIKDAKEYEIKLHPFDYDRLAQNKDQLSEIIKNSNGIKFIKDEHIECGGCRITTDLGEISLEPGKQMDIIMRELSNGD
ncbi:MAG: FliH/SctL family protein [Candidatus Omnitrophota bacterium]